MIVQLLLLFSTLSGLLVAAQQSGTTETILGVYIFHRHGDRTSKSWPPTSLTDLGFAEVYQSGNFYRNRYVASDASLPILGLSPNVVKNSQLNIQAPADAVLQNSAQGFLQAFYPPVGGVLGSQVLANGTNLTAPNGGFQLIPINAVTSISGGSGEESSAWLQGSSGCANAIISSNDYFSSTEYAMKLNETGAFYQSFLPAINTTFTSATDNFKNAYTIFDYIHVSEIHNQSIPSGNLLTSDVLYQVRTLADNHEFNLAYNSSESIRAIAGSTLAAQILQQLNATITGKFKQPLGIQFGAYGSFLSFFGLAGLTDNNANFTGLPDYASSMTFELVTNTSVSNTSSSQTYPSVDDISVRFLFANGSAATNPLRPYPLFNQSEILLPWTTFSEQMSRFAIGDQASWCNACGNSTGVCNLNASSSSSSGGDSTGTSSSSSSGGGGVSRPVAGVIGAMVTLAVILGLEALVMLFGDLRVVSKKRTLPRGEAAPGVAQVGKA